MFIQNYQGEIASTLGYRERTPSFSEQVNQDSNNTKSSAKQHSPRQLRVTAGPRLIKQKQHYFIRTHEGGPDPAIAMATALNFVGSIIMYPMVMVNYFTQHL